MASSIRLSDGCTKLQGETFESCQKGGTWSEARHKVEAEKVGMSGNRMRKLRLSDPMFYQNMHHGVREADAMVRFLLAAGLH